ncbi:MAG TPA: membrane dipeptidase, partial [Polyangiaceae bacterium]|nr:membrane dipeptidase [Polyangiaceae bacterium]
STNPLRAASERFEVLLENLTAFKTLLARESAELVHVRTFAEYRAARETGRHAAFIGIQGGNACDGRADSVESLPRLDVLRVTLVHLSNSSIGSSSAPPGSWAPRGLTDYGRRFIERLNAARIFVDLAHISPAGFWEALDAHDHRLPVIVTHTGVSGVHRHWRNLDDSQLRAIAATGGLSGIMVHAGYLGPGLFGARVEHVLQHIEHAVRVAGEDSVGIGSDFDGFIVPPRDLPSVIHYPRLIQAMLDRKMPESRIRKILGGNFLRVLRELRP